MRQLFLTGKRRLEWREIPDAQLEHPGDVLVEPLAIARCDLEPLMYERGYLLSRPPIPLGHEFTARIIAVGDHVQNFKIGDRVVAPFEISCGHCRPCQTGRSPGCRTYGTHASYGLGRGSHFTGGALADRIRIPHADHMLLKLPDNVDAVHAASLSDNVVEGWRAVGRELTQDASQSVLVLGGGAASIGLYTVATARALGAENVQYVDWDRDRLAIAESYGARVHEARSQSEWPQTIGEFELVLDAGASLESLHSAVRATAPCGILTSASVFFSDKVEMPMGTIYDRSITFRTGWVASREMLPHSLELIASGKLAPEAVTTLVADFERAHEAWPEPTTKVIARGPNP